MKKRILTIVAGLTICSFMAVAQEEIATPEETTTVEVIVIEEEEESSSELSISGSIDTYYRTVIGADAQAPGTSFADGNQFSMGMANVVLAKEGKKAGFVADLVFGPRGTQATFGSLIYDLDGDGNADVGNSAQIVNQLYAYWKASDNVTLTLGNFNTFLGYEVISPTGNFNYSTTYLFSYGPFSHNGVKADIALTDEFSLMAGVFNQTDQTESNPINNLHAGLQIGYTNDMGGAWLNFLGGNPSGADGDRATNYEIDLTTGWDLTDKLYTGLNVAYYQAGQKLEIEGVEDPKGGFFGTALYLQYAFSDVFALGFRGEYFQEKQNGSLAGTDPSDISGIVGVYSKDGDGIKGSVTDLTLSGNIFIGDLTIIPEIRVDMIADSKEFPEWKGYTQNGGSKGTNVLPSFLVAAVYAF